MLIKTLKSLVCNNHRNSMPRSDCSVRANPNLKKKRKKKIKTTACNKRRSLKLSQAIATYQMVS